MKKNSATTIDSNFPNAFFPLLLERVRVRLFFFLLVFTTTLNAQTTGIVQGTDFAIGNATNARSVATDAQGNIYETGYFYDTKTFGNGAVSITSAAAQDIYIVKYNSAGVVQWAKRAGGAAGNDIAYGIAISGTSVYITGIFGGTINFNNPSASGSNEITSLNGSGDIFVAKYDDAGNFIWAKRAGGTSTDYGYGIAANATGVYITGQIVNTADFNTPSASGSNEISSAALDAFVAKYDADGNFIWAKRAGGTSGDLARGIAVNGTSVYITGSFSTTANFNNPSNSSSNTISVNNGTDMFVAQYDTAGNFNWAKRGGGPATDIGYAVAANATGVYVTGYFTGTANFNTPSATGSNTITSAGNIDIFIAKYDNAGNIKWAKRAGGPANDVGYAIAVTTTGVYVTGSFIFRANFNTPSNYSTNSLYEGDTTSQASADVFVAKLDTTGNTQWVNRGGTGGGVNDLGYGITSNGISTYTVGNIGIGSTANFNNPYATGSNELTTSGNFLWELKETPPCTPNTGTFTVAACNSYTWAAKGNKVYTTNNNTDTIHLTNVGGCDSVVTLNLSIVDTVSAITGASAACAGSTTTLNNAVSGGVWFTQATSQATINSSTGFITAKNAGTITIKYSVAGCGSVTRAFTINAIPNVPTITYAPGTVGNPQDGAPRGSFCVGKKFRVAGTPNIPAGVWSVTGGVVITGYDTVNITAAIPGSIKYTYTDANGCSNSRTMIGNGFSCAARGVSVSGEGLVVSGDFTMYPNPAKGLINLNVETLTGKGSIVVTDLYGKAVKTQTLSMGNNAVDIANLSKGFYLVSIITGEGKTTKKLIVE